MKKISVLLLAASILAGCQKEKSTTVSKPNNDNLLTHKVTYSYKDTTTTSLAKTSNITLHDASFYFTLTANYIGNDYYTITAKNNNSADVVGPSYSIYKNGVAIESDIPINSGWDNFTFSRHLDPGVYYIIIKSYVFDGAPIAIQSQNLTIVPEPTAPAGMLCLYRYFNSTSGQHICTYDWQELASCSQGFVFEKVLGYTYPSASSAANLKPIYRYYKSATGSHFTTDIQGNYTGFVYEKVLGYVGTSATTTLSRSLTKYYLSSTDDHFVCVPPDVPTYPGFTKDIDFTFGYLQ
jgi:hypothetical protein